MSPTRPARDHSRLLELADFLDELPAEHFDFEVYTNKEHLEGASMKSYETMACGTTACALGWCPRVFPDGPLRWRPDGQLLFEDAKVAAFFDITRDEVDYMFYPNDYVEGRLPDTASKEEVAERMREFVAANGIK